MDGNTIRYILNQAEPKAIFADANTLPVVAELMRRNSHDVKAVIYTGQDSEVSEHINSLEKVEGRSFEIVHIDELKAKRRSSSEGDSHTKDGVETLYPQSDDVACVMYTSGSTGEPKGVLLTHGNLMAAIGSAAAMVGNILNKDEDIAISYLPLAHVLEFVISHFVVSMGCRLGFARARTLMDDAVVPTAGSGQTKGIGDLKALKPTLMAGVPTIWERIRKGILKEVSKLSFPVRQLFFAALNAKWGIVQITGSENIVTSAIDYMVFKQAREL
ncbi:long-chain fatty acid-CoA ligase, partial [Modicella reniformis]